MVAFGGKNSKVCVCQRLALLIWIEMTKIEDGKQRRNHTRRYLKALGVALGDCGILSLSLSLIYTH